MADRLKIYACSGIGETDKKAFAYWTDGTNSVSNTQAVNTLLVKINLAWSQFSNLRNLSKEDKISLLNEIDWLSVALDAAKRFSGDDAKLYHAGETISDMAKNGTFNGTSTDLREREERLEELIEKANELYSDDAVKIKDLEFMAWWKNTIVARNKVGLNSGQQQAVRKALKKAAEQIKGIGKADDVWKENEDIAPYLTQAGTYFLYRYFTKEQLDKLPGKFKLRKLDQDRIYNYCLQYFVPVYGDESDMQDIITSGIINEFGEQPEEVCSEIVSGKRTPGVGGFLFGAETAAAGIKMLIELLAVLTTLLVGIVSAICGCIAQTNVAKYGAIKKETIENGAPKASDYDEVNFVGGGIKSSSSLLTFAAIGAGLLLLLKR